jgi:hypothetical protein
MVMPLGITANNLVGDKKHHPKKRRTASIYYTNKIERGEQLR